MFVLERYYPAEDRWAFVAPMSVCRSGHGVGVVNGCLYALGGHDGVSYRNKVEYFDPQVGEWTLVGAQTRVLVLSPSLLLNHLKSQSSKA